MEAKCYTLDIYCDAKNAAHGRQEFPHQFTGRTYTDCKRQAKRRGWRFRRDDRQLCPRCNAAGLKPRQDGGWGNPDSYLTELQNNS